MQAGLGTGRYAIVAVALAVGLLTLYAVTRLWAEAFWKAAPEDAPVVQPAGRLAPLLAPSVVLAALTVAIGLGAEAVFTLARDAAGQLLDREGYVRAVLGGPP